jgi:hypothetical protein
VEWATAILSSRCCSFSKDKLCVFVTPISNVEDISDEVLTNWQSVSWHYLGDWVNMFCNAESAKAVHVYVTTNNLASESTYSAYANCFNSPRQGIQKDTSSKFGTFVSLTDDLNGSLKQNQLILIQMQENASYW